MVATHHFFPRHFPPYIFHIIDHLFVAIHSFNPFIWRKFVYGLAHIQGLPDLRLTLGDAKPSSYSFLITLVCPHTCSRAIPFLIAFATNFDHLSPHRLEVTFTVYRRQQSHYFFYSRCDRPCTSPARNTVCFFP